MTTTGQKLVAVSQLTTGTARQHLNSVQVYPIIVAKSGEAAASPAADAACNSAQVAQAVPAGDAIVLTTPGASAG